MGITTGFRFFSPAGVFAILCLLHSASLAGVVVPAASNLGEIVDPDSPLRIRDGNERPGSPGFSTWQSGSFTTSDIGGILDHVTLSIGLFMPGGSFTARIYEDDDGMPGDQLTELIPTAGLEIGLNDLTPSAPIELEANSTYWIVMGYLPESEGARVLLWDSTRSTDQQGIWTIGDGHAESTDFGETWTTDTTRTPLMSVSAEIPEPAEYAAIMALLSGSLIVWRRVRRCGRPR